jgi:hypothetical protein
MTSLVSRSRYLSTNSLKAFSIVFLNSYSCSVILTLGVLSLFSRIMTTKGFIIVVARPF